MKKFFALALSFNCVAVISASPATDFKQSKVTQVVNDVQIISAADQQEKTASVNDVFTMPDILRTGPASRAELVAEDDTVTRVGANTIFSFDPASRTIDLQQGSLLFHSPHGKGGGTIHTGSATASVLGSTLIVSATPNGGFKVISLEDQAEIKFLNGLHQQLNPGQMTYILPGGNQLAPIVIFRLDDLTQNSLLVKGFNHPLASMPLIIHEMEKQIKLIQSGKMADTGLLAGNNATADQVEVLDANTIQSTTLPKGAQAALNADATINQPSVTDSKIPVPPARIFMNSSFSLSGNNFFAGETFRGFAARNLFFNTPAAALNPLIVNLSSYADKPEFDFVAAQDMNIEGSVTFSGLSAQSKLSLVAGNQITLSPNVTLTANVSDFELVTPAAITLDGASILNNVGEIGLTSGSVITLNNAIFQTGLNTLTAPQAVNITYDAGAPIELNDVGINTDAGSGHVTISSSSGSLTVEDTSIQAHYLTVNSGDSILLDGSGKTFSASGAGATANFTAPNLVTLNNANLSAYGVVNLAANTITINGVTFGASSIDNFGTKTGEVNVNGTQTPGGLNIYNSHYGSTAITSAGQINLSSGPGSTPGMYSYANH
jgi:FecR protein